MAPIVNLLNRDDVHDQTARLEAYRDRERAIIEATAAIKRVARYLGEKVFYNESALEVIGLAHEVPNIGASLKSDSEKQDAKIIFGADSLTHIIVVPHFKRTGPFYERSPRILELRTERTGRFTATSHVKGYIPVCIGEANDVRFYPVEIFPQSEIFFPDNLNYAYAVANFEGIKTVYWASPSDGATQFDCTGCQLCPDHTLWLAYTDAKARDHNFSNVPGAFINPDPDFMRGVVKGLHNAYPEEFKEQEEACF